jgi:hypothetical protein
MKTIMKTNYVDKLKLEIFCARDQIQIEIIRQPYVRRE